MMANDPARNDPGDENKGESYLESAARYNDAIHVFVQSGKAEDAAEDAADQDP